MKPLALVLALAGLPLTLAFSTQPGAPSPRDLLLAERPLTSAEIAAVLGASRDALAGKTLRLSSSPVRPATEVIMGRMGQPRRVRIFSGAEGGTVGPAVPGSGAPMNKTRWREDRITIVDYTGRPAVSCGGSPAQGEMVIEYTQRRSIQLTAAGTSARATETEPPVWKVSARKRAERELGGAGITPLFEMLQGGGVVSSAEHREIGSRQARALVAPWNATQRPHPGKPVPVTGDPIPNVQGEPRPRAEVTPTQWLWIDTASLLPLRWDVSGADASWYVNVGFESFDLEPPAGVDVPECIP
jgi:hypothetical protein